MPNSASRIITGLLVPHFWSRNCLVLMKYTSALKGELKPYFQDLSAVMMGMFWVDSSYRPGWNTSASLPSFTMMATWLSRTVSCAPIMISLPLFS